MADATQGDTDVQYLGLLVPALIALIAGLLIHSFIIGVNVSDWWKGRSVTAVDHIITCIGMSRMCSQIVIITFFIYPALFRWCLISHLTLLIIDAVYELFLFATFWLTSLLSIILCLKIANLQTRLFLYLRRTIVHKTGYLIVAAIVFSSVNTFTPLSMAVTELIRGGTCNTTTYNLSMCFSDLNSIYNYTIGASFPILFCCISSVLLFSSLYHHTTKMKMSSNLSIRLETYYSAMRFIAVTFIYNTLHFLCHFACVLYNYFHCLTLEWLYIILGFLPVLHSSYLIYITAKLRSQMSKVLHNVTDFLFQRKDTETGENIEVVAQ